MTIRIDPVPVKDGRPQDLSSERSPAAARRTGPAAAGPRPADGACTDGHDLAVVLENLRASGSGIEDLDGAVAHLGQVRGRVLKDPEAAISAQANARPSHVLHLMQAGGLR